MGFDLDTARDRLGKTFPAGKKARDDAKVAYEAALAAYNDAVKAYDAAKAIADADPTDTAAAADLATKTDTKNTAETTKNTALQPYTDAEAAFLAVVGGDDATIQTALDVALQVAENYCDRKFKSATDSEFLATPQGRFINLKRFPITSVTSIKDNNGNTYVENDDYVVDKQRGRIVFLNYFNNVKYLSVDYVGGYATLPTDLVEALFGVFSVFYTDMTTPVVVPITDLPAGVSSINIPDVGSVNFSTGADTPASAPAAVMGIYKTLFQPYRNTYVN